MFENLDETFQMNAELESFGLATVLLRDGAVEVDAEAFETGEEESRGRSGGNLSPVETVDRESDEEEDPVLVRTADSLGWFVWGRLSLRGRHKEGQS